MPAETTVRARPHYMTIFCWILAPIVVLAFVLFAVLLPGKTDGGGAWGNGDRAAMVGLGLLFALAVLMFTRPRVRADADGVQVRNLFTTYRFSWQLVADIRFDDGWSWAALDLVDDDQVSLMAIQRQDTQRAVAAIRGLRELHAASRRRTGESTEATDG